MPLKLLDVSFNDRYHYPLVVFMEAPAASSSAPARLAAQEARLRTERTLRGWTRSELFFWSIPFDDTVAPPGPARRLARRG